MKKAPAKVCLLVLAFILTFFAVNAQTETDEKLVKECLENYMSGDGLLVEKAFDPSATMKYIDTRTGEFKNVPIAEYIARVKAITAKTERQIGIVYTAIEGTAAQARIKIETGKFIVFDCMSLLKIKGEWKIVSKIFSRTEK